MLRKIGNKVATFTRLIPVALIIKFNEATLCFTFSLSGTVSCRTISQNKLVAVSCRFFGGEWFGVVARKFMSQYQI